MTFEGLYRKLQAQATEERGHPQVFHEADIDGYHLYVADTSFGYGPQFSCVGPDHKSMWGCETGVWERLTVRRSPGDPVTIDEEDARFALDLAERAEWRSRFEALDSDSDGR